MDIQTYWKIWYTFWVFTIVLMLMLSIFFYQYEWGLYFLIFEIVWLCILFVLGLYVEESKYKWKVFASISFTLLVLITALLPIYGPNSKLYP